jgi:hypothetical protein
MRISFTILTATTLVVTAGAAFAAEPEACNGPCLIYGGSADYTAAWINPSDPTLNNTRSLLPSSESDFQFKANDSVSFIANIISEQVIDPVPGTDQIFRGLGTYVYVLQAQYDADNYSLWAGKIHPTFGHAWDITPGFHGTDLAEAYDLSERIGFGASTNFAIGGMAHRLEANSFTTDRTVLSESLFHNRGRTTLASGGAGNSKGISSVAVAWDGCMGGEADSCYDDGVFGYQLAARLQTAGSGGVAKELGLLGSMNTNIALGDETALKLFAEAAWFNNYDGSADKALVVTASAALSMGPMTYSATLAEHRDLIKGAPNSKERLLDLTAMYDLGEDVSFVEETWAVGANYSIDKIDADDVQTFGLKISTAFDKTFPLGK